MSLIFRQPPVKSPVYVFLCALALVGCSARNEMDSLEADLRSKEQAQEELLSRLARAEEDLKVARTDATALRQQLNKQHQVSLTEEQADVVYRAEGIKFNSLLTGGQNRDGQPGDEGLAVMLIPVDMHGDLVKLAGAVDLELFDMSLPANEQRLGHWAFSTAEVRAHWNRGLIGSGYLFQVDWQGIPVASELTLHARFTVNDGRKFDATTQVKVVPPSPRSTPLAAGDVTTRKTAARRRKEATTSSGQAVPASNSVISRRPASPDETPAGREMPPLRKPRIPESSHDVSDRAADGTITSDRWTGDTIPTLR
jgi:hypothetical protein